MSIHIRHYPALVQRSCDFPIVLLHGWAADSNSWQALLPYLNNHYDLICVDLPNFGGSSSLVSENIQDWLAQLLPYLPTRAIYLGWSLGGMLATALAAQYPERVAALITIASNTKFVRGDGYKAAMPAKIERAFYQRFVEAPENTLKRFCALEAQGETDERAALKQLRALQKQSAQHLNSGWASALQLLAAIDNRAAFTQLSIPGLHIFGDADALVPVAAAEALAQLNASQHIRVLPHCGHTPHISQPELIFAPLQEFLSGLDVPSGAL